MPTQSDAQRAESVISASRCGKSIQANAPRATAQVADEDGGHASARLQAKPPRSLPEQLEPALGLVVRSQPRRRCYTIDWSWDRRGCGESLAVRPSLLSVSRASILETLLYERRTTLPNRSLGGES